MPGVQACSLSISPCSRDASYEWQPSMRPHARNPGSPDKGLTKGRKRGLEGKRIEVGGGGISKKNTKDEEDTDTNNIQPTYKNKK